MSSAAAASHERMRQLPRDLLDSAQGTTAEEFRRTSQSFRKGPGSFKSSGDSGNITIAKPRPPRMRDLIGTVFSTAERIVFGTLCDYANANSEMWPPWVPRTDGFAAWPSIDKIAAVTKLTDRGVQNALVNLQAGNAIRCIYRSKGGAPKRQGDRVLPARTSCYLITPNSLHRSALDQAEPTPVEQRTITPNSLHRSEGSLLDEEPRSEIPITPKSVRDNPEVSSPDNPEVTSPEVFNHHHQKERPKERAKEKTERAELESAAPRPRLENLKTPSEISFPDDDEKSNPKPLMDPKAELRRRLRERPWLNGAIDVEAVASLIEEGLGYSSSRLVNFLAFEETLTTPQKVRNPAALYRKLLNKFPASEASRLQHAREVEQASKTPATLPSWTCSKGQCTHGVIETGPTIEICDCEAVQGFSSERMMRLRNTVDSVNNYARENGVRGAG